MVKELFMMELHDVKHPNTKEAVSVMRVAGGWIYTFYNQLSTADFELSHCFVPEPGSHISNEVR